VSQVHNKDINYLTPVCSAFGKYVTPVCHTSLSSVLLLFTRLMSTLFPVLCAVLPANVLHITFSTGVSQVCGICLCSHPEMCVECVLAT
jgi:hypothetical protein